MNVNSMADKAYYFSVRNGFHPDTVVEGEFDPMYMATRIALIHSEVSEALEELRKVPFDEEAFGDELADILIRTGDLAKLASVDLSAAVIRKMAKNEERVFSGNRRGLDNGTPL